MDPRLPCSLAFCWPPCLVSSGLQGSPCWRQLLYSSFRYRCFSSSFGSKLRRTLPWFGRLIPWIRFSGQVPDCSSRNCYGSMHSAPVQRQIAYEKCQIPIRANHRCCNNRPLGSGALSEQWDRSFRRTNLGHAGWRRRPSTV